MAESLLVWPATQAAMVASCDGVRHSGSAGNLERKELSLNTYRTCAL